MFCILIIMKLTSKLIVSQWCLCWSWCKCTVSKVWETCIQRPDEWRNVLPLKTQHQNRKRINFLWTEFKKLYNLFSAGFTVSFQLQSSGCSSSHKYMFIISPQEKCPYDFLSEHHNWWRLTSQESAQEFLCMSEKIRVAFYSWLKSRPEVLHREFWTG